MSDARLQWDAVRAVLGGRKNAPPLRALERPHRSRASYVQERLCSLPDAATRGSAAEIRLRGALDVGALGRALVELVRRHESLRTTFELDEGHWFQRVGEVPGSVLVEGDLDDAFDLAKGPLFRAGLTRLAPADHRLVIAAHDAVLDSWSFENLMRDLCGLYAGSSLPALPLQYPDYAQWQRAREVDTGPALERLRGARPSGRFSTGNAAGRESRLVSPSTSAALSSFASREGATLFMVLLAAFELALHDETGETDLVVGCPVAARNHAELEHIVGPVSNMLALRTSLAGSPTVAGVHDRVREVVIAGLAHHDVPYERIVETLGAQWQDLPISFAMQNVPRSGWAWPGLETEAAPLAASRARRDLALTVQDGADGLRVWLEYDAVRIGEPAASRLVSRFVARLEAIAGQPATSAAPAVARPPDELERVLLAAYEQILEIRGLHVDDNFFDRGGDSLAAVRLGVVIEQRLQLEVPLVLLFEQPTPARLAAALRHQRHAAGSDPYVVPIKEGKRPRPLFLGAGGRSARNELMLYAKLLSHSRSDDQVYGLLARPDRDSLEGIAADHVASMRAIQPTGPYRVGGECVGGLVAYEIAQQLRTAGEEVELLLLIDTWCPTTLGSVRNAITLPWLQLKAGAAFFAGLPDRPADAEPWPRELWRRAITPPAARRYIRACHRYRPRPYAGAITMLMSEENVRRGWATAWQWLADGGFTLHRTPGGRQSYGKAYLDATARQLRRSVEGGTR